MITREELKVGDKRQWAKTFDMDGAIFTITAIGIKDFLYVVEGDEKERWDSIESAIKHSNPAPKPKKKIKLLGYICKNDGMFVEYKSEHEYEVWSSFKKVSEREIEVDDV